MKIVKLLIERQRICRAHMANYPAIREKYLRLKEDRLKWELLKLEIRILNISYRKYKGKQSRNRVEELQDRLEALKVTTSSNTEEQLNAEVAE